MLLNTCRKIPIMMSSMVLLNIGLRESATGRQFALRYALVDASINRVTQIVCFQVVCHIPNTRCPSKRLPMCNFRPPMLNFTRTSFTSKKWNPSFSIKSTSLSAVISKFSRKDPKFTNVTHYFIFALSFERI